MNSKSTRRLGFAVTVALASILLTAPGPTSALAQEQTAAAGTADAASTTPEPLSADELEVLVARIALYPDELVAVITAASLYPLQIVEASRYLDDYAKDKSLKPKESWDGSVISLLNYPEVVKMMSDDLEWTQQLGDAIAYQQKDVLVAIQQLREEAVAKNIVKTDDKMKVETQGDNIVIQSVNPQTVYVPQYEPQMLYVEDYPAAPIAYYPEPYPSYWYPGATFFAGAVTGAIWAAAVDWDDWDVWGGHWDGGDIDIDCDHCFNNRDFNGKVNFNDIDWKNVDRSKIKFDKDQFAKFDRTNIKNRVESNRNNSVRDRAADIKRNQAGNLANRNIKANDIRKSTLDGLKNRPGGDQARRPDGQRPAARPAGDRREAARPNADRRPDKVNRPAGKPKAANRVDNRPKKPSGLGNVDRGKTAKMHSNRGQKAMGGGSRGGGRAIQHGGGGRQQMHRGGGGGRHAGGGHRGGGRRR
ncbi:DUF3300 domain-containing protein [Mesorhizobium sp. LHD-90]|uniref:DUF3300 domain-containing protein n=1 Tax=Mesorhizobium sp. LHD-90 TaxID=3071414 RepID=UPI0027E0FB1D|nr:DUF3300 domain-containing protein [Mesorhizobium sp. LHD-90]MDQ6434248.1 DUF3300 domain-containing protein [Mesorhizobium sp. LHD-90]